MNIEWVGSNMSKLILIIILKIIYFKSVKYNTADK